MSMPKYDRDRRGGGYIIVQSANLLLDLRFSFRRRPYYDFWNFRAFWKKEYC